MLKRFIVPLAFASASVALVGGQLPAAADNVPGWSTMTTTDPGTSPLFEGVSCPSLTFCVAVGTTNNGGTQQALAEEWNGSTWSTMTVANPGASPILAAVSCTSATFCVAVGLEDSLFSYFGNYGFNYPYPSQAIAEEWNGSTWSTMTVANPGTSDALSAVSCTSPTFCAAVGTEFVANPFGGPNSVPISLQEEWTGGSQWTATAATNELPATDLSGVSCASATFCMAVGMVNKGNPITDQWDGSTWTSSFPPLPTPLSTEASGFTGISCTSASWCMAVGGYFDPNSPNSGALGFAEQWSGGTWSVLAMDTPSSNGFVNSPVNGVSCPTTQFCVAAGSYLNNASVFQTVANEWNGSTWSAMTPTNPSPYGDILNGVSCALTAVCAAAGLDDSSTGNAQTLAEVLANPPTSKDQCKNGGWMQLTEANGMPFTNQGYCVSYVETGGRNG